MVIVFITDVLRSRQLFPDASVAVVVSVLEGKLIQESTVLILRLKYKAQVSLYIVHKVGIKLLGTVHLSVQYGSLLLVGKGVTNVAVLVY